VQEFTEREFKRVMMIDEYKDVFYEHYGAKNKTLELKD
jgi:hypothetical protein